MHEIKELEKNWKKHKRKNRWGWFKVVLIFTILSFLVIFSFNFIPKDFKFPSIPIFSSKDKNQDKDNNFTSLIVEPFYENIQYREEKVKKVEKNITKVIKKEENSLIVEEDIPILEEVEEIKPLVIIETNSNEAYRSVEKRFKQNKSVDDALFLSRVYYKKRLYKKSAYWALEANKIDDTIEETLFLFVKSKAKLKEKKEAIRILNEYIKKVDSKKAKELLEKIEKNRI